MNEGYISIVSHNDFESVLRCFEEGGFLPESPTGECKLLDEVGDQLVVTEGKFRSEFSLPSAFGDALGLLWKNW